MKRIIAAGLCFVFGVVMLSGWTTVIRPQAKIMTYQVLIDEATPTLMITNATIAAIKDRSGKTAALVNISVFNSDSSYSIKFGSSTAISFTDTARYGAPDELPARTRMITGSDANMYGIASGSVTGSTVTVTVEYIW